MFNFAFLKKIPWGLGLRTLALAFILLIFGLQLRWLPEQIQRLKRGVVYGINFKYMVGRSEAIVNDVNIKAIEKGVSVGDIVLNPEAMTEGEIGTSVTLLIKSGDAPAREVTFVRESINLAVYTATHTRFVGLSPRVRLYFVLILLWVSVLGTGVFSVVAYLFRSDAWLAFFVVAAITNFLSILGPNIAFLFFWSYFPTALILFLILFPNGRLDPKWSWLLVLSPLPSTFRMVSFYTWQQFTRGIFDNFNPIPIFVILYGVIYKYRKSFTLIEQRRMKWLLFGLILISVPSPWLAYLGFSTRFIQGLNWLLVLHQGEIIGLVTILLASMGLLSISLVLGVVIYRYRNIFTLIERQKTKWLIFGLALWVPPIAVLKMFNIYYSYSNQYNKLIAAGHISDGIFLFGWIAFAASAVLASFHYRLEDVDSFINRALVYSGLIAMVGVTGLMALVFIDYTLGEITTRQKVFMVVPISIFLIAVSFKPARYRLQAFVDKYFKSEDFDFAKVFFEFIPEIQMDTALPDLLKLLAKRSYEQFGVTYASAFIKNRNGKLQHVSTVLMSGEIPPLVIDIQELSKLKRGELVSDIDSAYSIIIPLVLSRGENMDLMGALVLGPRLNGLGYSTNMKKSLIDFGQEVGKALYMARIRNQKLSSKQILQAG